MTCNLVVLCLNLYWKKVLDWSQLNSRDAVIYGLILQVAECSFGNDVILISFSQLQVVFFAIMGF